MSTPLTFLQHLARKAGLIMLRHYGREVNVKAKADGTPVTQVDLAISQLVCKAVQQHYPGHGLLTEETKGRFAWRDKGFIIDELDGTSAFVRRKGGFAFQAAYYENDCDILCAVIYDPLRDMMLCAEKGQGVYLMAKQKRLGIGPMPVRKWEYLRFAHHRQLMRPTHQRMYERMRLKAEQIVATGCVAAKIFDFILGRVDALIALNRFISPWDWAPAHLILSELGYGLCHLNGQPLSLHDRPGPESFGYLVAPRIHLPRLVQELSWIGERIPCDSAKLKA